MIAERLPATLELSLVAALFALLAGIPMGVYAALHPARLLTKAFLTISLIGISLPTFFIGILLILVFGVWLGLLPTFGRGAVVDLGWWTTGLLTASGWKSILMPAFTLGMFQLTLIMRLVRSEMLEVLRTDYIKFARARGLTDRAVNFGHALRNTLVPVITITGLQLGSIIAFAIITETVFQWPGMGLLFLQAIQFADIPVMASYLVLIALFFVVDQPRGRHPLPRGRPQAPHRPRGRGGVGRAPFLPSVMVGRGTTAAVRRTMGAARIRDHDLWHDFTASRITVAAAAVTLAIVLAALFAPWITPQNPFDPAELDLLDAFTPPVWAEGGDWRFVLGTDDQGRDLYSAMLHGARISLLVGFASVLLAAFIGVTLGLVAGYAGGAVDATIMRIADIQISFPAILIALLIDGVARGILPRDRHDELALYVLVFAIGASGWVQFARTVRGSTLVEKNKEYVQAARVIGVRPRRSRCATCCPTRWARCW